MSLGADSSWTVVAYGGALDVLYEVRLRQNGVPRQDEGATIARVYADDARVVTATLETMDYREFPFSNFYPTLIPGTARVTVVKARAGGGPSNGADTLATCRFGVVE